jgi:hypothetical protein
VGCRAHPRPAAPMVDRTASPGIRGPAAGMEVWWWVVVDRTPEEHPTGLPTPGEHEDAANATGGDEEQQQPDGEQPDPQEKDDEGADPRKPIKPPKKPPKPDPIVYTFNDGRADIEEVLGPYLGRPVPLPQETLDRWHTSGLRAISVPRADLEGLEQRLRLSGPVNRQWLGQVTSWSDIAQGPWRPERSTVKVEDQDVQLAPGRLRLSMRCWSIPPEDGAESGILRLELAPELEPYRTDQDRLLVTAGLAPPKDGAPAPFERLRLTATIQTDDAILILPERPGVSWAEPRERDVSPLGGPAPMPDNPSLGEAMLERALTDRQAHARAVLVLIPTPGEKFELLGR